ncbi:MAG TPA: hypothetical protein PLE35_11415, partial [Lentisphaeria bacterium]|nr:hypothetical protein [Lentisphaeria bacterium]
CMSRAGLLSESQPAPRRNVFMAPDHVEDMLAHASARFALQIQKQDRVSISANAMRDMLEELMTGEVNVIDNIPVMRMPDGYMTREYGEWVAIVPALDGWVDCMQRIAPELSSESIVNLGRLIGAGEEITPELVMVARMQLEDQITAMKRLPICAINAAVESTKSDWRAEQKQKKETETMNARDNAPAMPAIDGAINAAHGLLLKSGDALSADDVAKALGIKKAEASKQLRELHGLGLLESEPRKGGTMYFRLAVVAPAKVCDLVQTEGESQTDTLAADADGWIPWNATADGVSPVPEKTKVSVRLKDGDVLRNSAEHFSWISGECIPIVAYKILDAAPANFATSPEMQHLAPEDYELPPADPELLASANRMLSDRLERVAHVLRGCGLPALTEISDQEDLQMAAAALSGAYQMALADAAAVPDLRNTVTELDATVTLQRETLVVAASDVSRLSNELATERRVSGSAISAVASICEHLGCDDHNGHVPVLRAIDDLRAQIASLTADVMRTRGSLNSAINEADRLRAELAVERQACKTLQERSSTAPVRAATSFIVRAAKRKPRTFSSIEKAREAAMAAIRAGAQRAEVCPMLPPIGVARKGAEWRAA